MFQRLFRTYFSFSLFILLACIHLSAQAQLVYGQDYLDVPGYQKSNESKIPVLEFFWYESDKCFEVENLLNTWAHYHKSEVKLIHVPIPFGNEEPMARIYYALKASGYGERFHRMIYYAIHVDNTDLMKGATFRNWLLSRGVNLEPFETRMHSQSVDINLKKAAELARRYSVLELPTIVIDGRYVTNLGFAGSPDRLYIILDKLLAKAQADKLAGR